MSAPKPKVYGLWHGGVNYAESDRERDLEEFESIVEAVEALRDRAAGHWRKSQFRYVFRDEEWAATPVADEGASMDLWFRFAVDDLRDPWGRFDDPDRTLSLTPRGAVRDGSGRYY